MVWVKQHSKDKQQKWFQLTLEFQQFKLSCTTNQRAPCRAVSTKPCGHNGLLPISAGWESYSSLRFSAPLTCLQHRARESERAREREKERALKCREESQQRCLRRWAGGRVYCRGEIVVWFITSCSGRDTGGNQPEFYRIPNYQEKKMEQYPSPHPAPCPLIPQMHKEI